MGKPERPLTDKGKVKRVGSGQTLNLL